MDVLNEEVISVDALFDILPPDMYGKKPVYDGIIDIDKYNKSKFKIMWILKESHDKKDGGGWDFRFFLKDGFFIRNYKYWRKTFSNIIQVTYGIMNDISKYEDVPDAYKISEIIESIAYINLKKIPGTTSSKKPVIRKYYKNNKELILKQLDVFKPDIVIGGSTLEFMYSDLGITNKRNIRWKSFVINSTLFIDAYHPDSRITSREYYLRILKEVERYFTKSIN